MANATSKDALQILAGASNPRGVSRVLTAALDEDNLPAARLIWEHLGELLNVGCDYSAGSPHRFGDDMRRCELDVELEL